MGASFADAELPRLSFESCGSGLPLSSISSQHTHLFGGGTRSGKSSSFSCSSSSTTSTDARTSESSTRRTSCERGIVCMLLPISTITSSKPHKAHDDAWASIHALRVQDASQHQHQQSSSSLGISHFKILGRLGHGDIGSVFLAQLRSHHQPLFAIKVMDKEALLRRKKLHRMHTEREILECVDHPFLPTLYAHFETKQFACLVMEYCPGGDLHALRQRPSCKRFTVKAARFYAAEVLLALEYLHMLGIVYRDLKPENVMVRDDGHIMLTDFDLCLKCEVEPVVVKSAVPSSMASTSTSMPSSLSSSSSGRRRLLRSLSQSSASSTTSFLQHGSNVDCMLPAVCGLHPAASCLPLRTKHYNKKLQHTQSHGSKSQSTDTASRDASEDCADGPSLLVSKHGSARFKLPKFSSLATNVISTQNAGVGEGNLSKRLTCQEEAMLLQLIAEPTQARSMSFVGTHEYLAPEMIAGQGHGSAVDWWTFGIFLFELLYGKTPFKGPSNDQTLANVLKQELRFPQQPSMAEVGEADAKSLISSLLRKDPRQRLGSMKGAAEIKQHPFFRGINWALIRCMKPPEVPNILKLRYPNHHHQEQQNQASKTNVFTYRAAARPPPHFEYF